MSNLNDINESNDVNIKMEWISTSNGVQLYTKTFEPKHSDNLNGLIFFIHGFAEYTDRYNHIFPIFAKNNLKVSLTFNSIIFNIIFNLYSRFSHSTKGDSAKQHTNSQIMNLDICRNLV